MTTGGGSLREGAGNTAGGRPGNGRAAKLSGVRAAGTPTKPLILFIFRHLHVSNNTAK